MSYIITWFSIWGVVFAAVFVWRGVQRIANRWLEPHPVGKGTSVATNDYDNKTLKQEQEVQTETQRRRDEARATCEKLFMLHAPEIRERFTREMHDDFVKRHLHDGRTADEVERRAEELCEIIRSHLEKTNGRATKSLAELAEWFLRERNQIEATGLSPGDKDDLIAQLEERYARLQERYLRRVQP